VEILKEAYKVWKNPETAQEPPRFMGDFYPPGDQATFIHDDLRTLGFPPGDYTVHIPAKVRERYALPKWQMVRVGE
jgi:hypothetical protein